MRTSEKVAGLEHDRTPPSAARWGRLVAGFTLAILIVAAAGANPSHAGTSSPPPTSECSEFACEK